MRLQYLVGVPLLAASSAFAQVSVAVLGVPAGPCFLPDVQAKVQATGYFGTVDVYDIRVATPSVPTLLGYDAVLVYSDGFGYHDSFQLGDNLADYVDGGGGVVTATFVSTAGLDILGRWKTGYEVILTGGQQQGSQEFLGTVHVPGHPLLTGVSSFDGGWQAGTGSYRPWNSTLAAGATLIAEWTDGTPLVVLGAHPKRVDLGFYPVSSACDLRLWNEATDGDLLLANALRFVGGGPPLSTYCTAGTTSHGCVPSIAGTGTPSASASSGFAISVSAVEGMKSGLIFYGIDNSGFVPTPWGLGGTSFLCVKAPTQRTAPQSSGGSFNQCDGVLSIDWNSYVSSTPGALGTPFAAGANVFAQAWFRDPPAAKTTNLSDGLHFLVMP
jgi:hypothetical protein